MVQARTGVPVQAQTGTYWFPGLNQASVKEENYKTSGGDRSSRATSNPITPLMDEEESGNFVWRKRSESDGSSCIASNFIAALANEEEESISFIRRRREAEVAKAWVSFLLFLLVLWDTSRKRAASLFLLFLYWLVCIPVLARNSINRLYPLIQTDFLNVGSNKRLNIQSNK